MSLNRITPPAVRFELHAYGEIYDFSLKSIANWKDLEFTLQRDKTSGVFHQISFPFEFVLDAYDVVKRIFDTYKYRAVSDMYIYLLKDNWPYVTKEEQYFEPQIFNLDWTQYNKSDNKIEIDTKRTSLYDFIKAKNKIVYDIPVSEIKEDKQWNFERIQLENSITFRAYNENTIPTSGGVYHRTVGISYESSEVSVKDKIYERTVPDLVEYKNDMWHTDNDKNFIEVVNVPFNTKMRISIDLEGTIDGGFFYPGTTEKATLFLTKKYNTSDPYADAIAWKDYSYPGTNVEIVWKEELEIPIVTGDRLYLIYRLELRSGSPSGSNTFSIKADGTIKAMYEARNDVHAKIDLIDPKILLQSLVDKMTDSENKYLSDIEDFNTDKSNLIMMSAAESIRGIQETDTNEAKVHTSYRSFVEWMNTYGYEQHIVDNILTFKKRYKSFRGDLTAIELGERECDDLRESVNDDYLYSGLKIGYNRKDIENTNVRFEFNGVHDYSTDLNLGENILKLISPYRADCYGIEFLTQERGKDSTDDKSDKDLFLINVSESGEFYKTIYSVYSGNYPNNTIFNGNLNPYNLMKLNEDLLGVSVNKLSFTASDSNSGIIIDGQGINEDHDIPEGLGLFDAHMYDIASKNIQHLPSGENVNGIVRFKYKGQTYEGFIEEVSKNPAWEMETVWILYKRKSL